MTGPLSDGVSTFHFDFHKNLSSPKLSCQQSYFSSKLTTYAFGIHSGGTGKGTTYVWPESTAPKHPDTLLSCLDFHLSNVEENRKWNIFWADNTRSQNKNYTVCFYFENLVSSGAKRRIDYKFLLSGHSFGEVDRDGGRTESVLRREETIETPMDYVNLINNSQLSPKITWIEMEQHRFKCYSEWLRRKYTDRNKDIHGRTFRFSDVMHFNYGIGERIDPVDGIVKTFSHPGIVWMRKTFDPTEEPTEVDLRKRGQQVDLHRDTLSDLNNEPIKLSEKKCHDLLNLSKFLSPGGKAYFRDVIGQQ